jgi:hypothetical protein
VQGHNRANRTEAKKLDEKGLAIIGAPAGSGQDRTVEDNQAKAQATFS